MKAKTAFLIIDLQKAFKPTPKLIAGILKRAKRYDVVVATEFQNGNKLFQTVLKFPPFKKSELKLVELPTGTKIFKKTGYGLPGTLLAYLKRKKVTKVDICGLDTDACVLASMYQLWDAGIQPVFIKKLSGSLEPKVERASYAVIKRNFRS